MSIDYGAKELAIQTKNKAVFDVVKFNPPLINSMAGIVVSVVLKNTVVQAKINDYRTAIADYKSNWESHFHIPDRIETNPDTNGDFQDSYQPDYNVINTDKADYLGAYPEELDEYLPLLQQIEDALLTSVVRTTSLQAHGGNLLDTFHDDVPFVLQALEARKNLGQEVAADACESIKNIYGSLHGDGVGLVNELMDIIEALTEKLNWATWSDLWNVPVGTPHNANDTPPHQYPYSNSRISPENSNNITIVSTGLLDPTNFVPETDIANLQAVVDGLITFQSIWDAMTAMISSELDAKALAIQFVKDYIRSIALQFWNDNPAGKCIMDAVAPQNLRDVLAL